MPSEKSIGKPCAGKLHARFDEEGLVRLPMEWLLRHRQTKEAEIDKQVLMAIKTSPLLYPSLFRHTDTLSIILPFIARDSSN